MIQASLLLLALLPQDPPTQGRPTQAAATTPWRTTRLQNGVRINVLQVKDAPMVTAFSFLPVGLDGDPVGRAQFSHLAEHMLIRSTDPSRLRQGELQLNGETTNQVMRLESFAPPARWKDALLRHPRWLTARTFNAKTLAREKVMIASEERGTVPQGFNHKWATAAWAQIVAGRKHAAVHGDVAAATVEQIQAYVAEHVRLREAQLFVIGPKTNEEVVEVLTAEFARHAQPASKPVSKPASRPARPAAQEPTHHKATWDLAANHYLEWVRLPEDCTAAEASVLGQVLMMVCFQERAFQKIPGRAVAGVVSRHGKRYVLLSANRPAETKVEDLQAGFAKALAKAPGLARLQVRGSMFAQRFGQTPDFNAQRRMVQNPRFRKLVEANFAMQAGYASTRLGVPIGNVPAEYSKLEAGRIVALVQKHCTAGRRHSAELSRRRD